MPQRGVGFGFVVGQLVPERNVLVSMFDVRRIEDRFPQLFALFDQSLNILGFVGQEYGTRFVVDNGSPCSPPS